MTYALADEPFKAGKVESTAQMAHTTMATGMLRTVALSPPDMPGAYGSLNVGVASPVSQATTPQAPAEPSVVQPHVAVDFGVIPGMPVYLQALTACLLMFSAFVSWRVARISRFNVQVDVFQKLRNAFVLLSPKLPRQFWAQQELPDDYEELCAMQRYWYQSFDEWFITQVLHPKTLGRLWKTYYRDSILKNCESPAMIAALIRTKQGTDAKHFEQFFQVVVCRGWRGRKKISTYEEAEKLADKWNAHLAAQKQPDAPAVVESK
jgi:hypothetical protein